MRDSVAIALLVLGSLVVMASCVAMAALSDPLDRLHVVTPASTLGVAAACAAVIVHEGLDASGTAALLLAAVTATTSPLIGHATARSIHVRRQADAAEAGGPVGAPGAPAQ